MIRIGILGASGYTAFELIRILLRHPHAKITCLTTRNDEKRHIDEVHPGLAGRLDLTLDNLTPGEIASRADCVFSCLPHAASAGIVSDLLCENVRVVDFSADYRLDELHAFEEWYKTKHPDPDRIGKVPYGLPELNSDAIKKAKTCCQPGLFSDFGDIGIGSAPNK